MAKKVSFDNLPQKVEQILELLLSEGSEHNALPEIVQRVKRLEMQYDSLERLLSTNRRTMDKQTVFRLLKIRPRQLGELEKAGQLLSHSEGGRRTYYYEDDVVRCFMNQSQWKNVLEAATKPSSDESAEPEVAQSDSTVPMQRATASEITGRIDIKAAGVITGRNSAAIYQLVKTDKIPYEKDGRNLVFNAEKLKEWVKTHPARKYQKRKNRTEPV